MSGEPTSKEAYAVYIMRLLVPCASALAALAALTPTISYAQGSSDAEMLRLLREEVEALSQTIEEQADTLEKQADDIARLQKGVSVTDPGLGEKQAAVQLTPTEEELTDGQDDRVADYRIGRYPDSATVRPGDFDKSITIPGDGGSFRIGGFVRAQLDYDIDNIGIQGNAVPYTIPLDGTAEDGTDQFGFNVRDTQLNFDYRRDTDLGLVRAFVEFDFFGDGGDEFDNDYGVRIRHAAVGIGNFQAGQFWSLFTDLSSIPEVVELLGPHGAPVFRTPGVRWYDEIGDNWKWAIGLEDPAGDLSGDESQFASESVPNVVGYIERTGTWGHVRLTGLGLELKSTTDKTYTGGGSLTGRVNVPLLHPKDAFFFGGQVGAGFAKQYAGFGSVGLEGVVDEDGNIEATGVLAGYVGVQHWWATTWRSNAYVSVFDFDQGALAEPGAFSHSFKTAGNVFWTPVRNLNLGAEALYITQETVAGDEGEGLRVQFVAQLNF